MKNFLLFCFLLLAGSTKIHAQPYPSIFGNDSTVWYVFGYDFDGGIPYEPPTLIHTVKGDTIINGLHYRKVTTRTTRPTQTIYPFLIREELNTGKVWTRQSVSIDTSERLLIDFSLQIGDTFKRIPNSFQQRLVVDSVYFDVQGRKHIRFNDRTNIWNHQTQATGNSKPEFITSVGNNWGLRYNFCYNSCMPEEVGLICAYKDREHIYQDTASVFNNGCIYPVGISDATKEKSPLKLSPNPVSDWLSISLPADVITANIYNIAGQKMWNFLKTNHFLSIDCSHWPPGLYVLRLQDRSGSTSSQTFLKQ